jgi:ribosomal protein L37E
MFKKKKIKCPRCGKKIEKKFDYCPYCRFSLKEKDEVKDFTREFEKAMKMPFFVKFPFRQIVKQLEKQIDSQMRVIDKDLDRKKIDPNQMRKIPISGINIKISAGGGEPRVIRIGNLGKPVAKKPSSKRIIEKKGKSLEKTKVARFAKLEKTEPETKVRRLTDRIVYEISVPGVKSVKDVAIIRLENSIEIKALAKDKAYFKLIPISLPIKDYTIEDERLIIELIP